MAGGEARGAAARLARGWPVWAGAGLAAFALVRLTGPEAGRWLDPALMAGLVAAALAALAQLAREEFAPAPASPDPGGPSAPARHRHGAPAGSTLESDDVAVGTHAG
jgi:hypothetical protein